MLKILGWEAIGLRCPDHRISLENNDGSVKPVSLVQMPNGTGKTTTLNLIRAALAGPDMWEDPEFKKSGNESARNFAKRGNIGSGQFDLQLSYKSVYNDTPRRSTIRMNFDFSGGDRPEYSTSVANGFERGYHPPTELESLLKPNFVKLLVFDGEHASRLLNAAYTDARLAVDEVYQLYNIRAVKNRLNKHFKEIVENAGAAVDEDRIIPLQKRVDYLTERFTEKCKEIADLDERRTLIETEIYSLNEKFEEQLRKDSEYERQSQLASAKLREAENSLSKSVADLFSISKNPARLSPVFRTQILNLKESLDRVKLPGIAAKEFFEEIAEEQSCICGREITEEIKSNIKQRASYYLGSEKVTMLNTMKTTIRDKFDDLNDKKDVDTAAEDVLDREESLTAAQNQMDRITSNASKTNPEIRSIKEKIGALSKELGEVDKELKKFDLESRSDESNNPEELNSRLEKAQKELSLLTNTIKDKNKLDALRRILNSALNNARERLIGRLCRQANDRIKTIMPLNNVRIESIDQSLTLEGQAGASEGEKLCVCYSFLTALAEEKSLPFLMDSPVNPIDLGLRPEIGKLIPKLGDQFIAFTISSERQGFLKPLEEAAETAGKSIAYTTLFRKIRTESGVNGTEDTEQKLETQAIRTSIIGKQKTGCLSPTNRSLSLFTLKKSKSINFNSYQSL